MHKKYKTTK